nr:hypothetical protein Iba_chr04bCG10180 [Ipomoea batatas]
MILERLGFASLLDFNVSGVVPPRLVYWLLSNFDAENEGNSRFWVKCQTYSGFEIGGKKRPGGFVGRERRGCNGEKFLDSGGGHPQGSDVVVGGCSCPDALIEKSAAMARDISFDTL